MRTTVSRRASRSAISSAYADGVLTVSETDIRRAMVRAARGARLVLEPSGATSLAAWLSHEPELPPDGPVVVILSGGNVDPDRYAELIAEGHRGWGMTARRSARIIAS